MCVFVFSLVQQDVEEIVGLDVSTEQGVKLKKNTTSPTQAFYPLAFASKLNESPLGLQQMEWKSKNTTNSPQ